MITLEQAITEYLKLRRPQFCAANPQVPTILSAAVVSLASRMWIDGTDLIPAVWYIALTGPPRTGKSAIIRTATKLFDKTGVHRIPTGSPEAMLMEIDSARHGYIRFDEIGQLVKLMNSYMGPLINILNSAYYLEELGQTRMDKKKSVVVPAEEYFIHVYMSGLPEDWAVLERNAVGGFIRRTLVIPARGHIPFFRKAHKNRGIFEYLAQLRSRISRILDAMRYFNLTVFLPEFPELGEILEKTQLDMEKKSMVEEYFYKLLAGRILANLITFDITEDVVTLDVNEIVHRMIANSKKLNVTVEVQSSTQSSVTLDVIVPELDTPIPSDSKTLSLDSFMPPHYAAITFFQLLETVKPQVSAPDSVTLDNVRRIQQWLEAGNPSVVSTYTFVRKILHTGNPQFYRAVIDLLEEGGYIRVVEFPYKGRTAKYIILDTKARICGNCAFYRNPERCPKLKGCLDIEDCKGKVAPWEAACEKFEPADSEEG